MTDTPPSYNAPTYAETSAKLLNDAAGFFRMLAEENETVREQMNQNADIFEGAAVLVLNAPEGETNGNAHKDIASNLLNDAARFFRSIAPDNPPIEEQMIENANIYDHIAERVRNAPLDVLLDQ